MTMTKITLAVADIPDDIGAGIGAGAGIGGGGVVGGIDVRII
jgi:hypothetical protein